MVMQHSNILPAGSLPHEHVWHERVSSATYKQYDCSVLGCMAVREVRRVNREDKERVGRYGAGGVIVWNQ